MEEMLLFSKQFTTVLFFTFFMIVLVWTYWKGNKERIESIKMSIFEEDEIRRIQ